MCWDVLSCFRYCQEKSTLKFDLVDIYFRAILLILWRTTEPLANQKSCLNILLTNISLANSGEIWIKWFQENVFEHFIGKISVVSFSPQCSFRNDELCKLTHWGRVTHICVVELGHHWFRQWLVVCSAPKNYPNQCWIIVNWTLENKLQWNLNRYLWIFIQENSFENVVWKMAAIFCRPQCVNTSSTILVSFMRGHHSP